MTVPGDAVLIYHMAVIRNCNVHIQHRPNARLTTHLASPTIAVFTTWQQHYAYLHCKLIVTTCAGCYTTRMQKAVVLFNWKNCTIDDVNNLANCVTCQFTMRLAPGLQLAHAILHPA